MVQKRSAGNKFMSKFEPSARDMVGWTAIEICRTGSGDSHKVTNGLNGPNMLNLGCKIVGSRKL